MAKNDSCSAVAATALQATDLLQVFSWRYLSRRIEVKAKGLRRRFKEAESIGFINGTNGLNILDELLGVYITCFQRIIENREYIRQGDSNSNLEP
jgi:hypothetical protein